MLRGQNDGVSITSVCILWFGWLSQQDDGSNNDSSSQSSDESKISLTDKSPGPQLTSSPLKLSSPSPLLLDSCESKRFTLLCDLPPRRVVRDFSPTVKLRGWSFIKSKWKCASCITHSPRDEGRVSVYNMNNAVANSNPIYDPT